MLHSLTLSLVLALAGPPPAPDEPLSVREFVALAHDDAAQATKDYGPEYMRHQFYVWLTGLTPEERALERAAIAYAINTALSHNSNLYRPVPVGDRLVRIDKRELTPEYKDRLRLDLLFENTLALQEPYTHRTGLVRAKDGNTKIKVKCLPYPADDGRTYDYRFELIRKEDQFAPHTGIGKMLGLFSMLGETGLPICRADWFVSMILSTQKVGRADGLYYEFRGWDVKKTTQDDILRELGAGEDQIAEQKITLREQIAKAKGDADKIADLFDGTSRAMIYHSGVTDRERRADAFVGSKLRPAAGVQVIFLTHDLDRKSVDPEQDPTQNLIAFPDDGREGIGFLPNGMQAYWASNGKGTLVKSVPEGIAHDSTIPHPSPQTLEPGISCIACHGGHDGYIPVNNDILTLTRERIPTDDPRQFQFINVFDDDALTGLVHGYSAEQVKAILRSLFGKDMSPAILLAQQQHARATAEVTGGYTVAATTAQIARMRGYVFGMVDAETALAEAGVRFVPPEYGPLDDAKVKEIKRRERLKEVVRETVPPLPKLGNRSAEHPTINALRTGRLTVTRAQWENVFPDWAGRADAERLRKLEPGQN